jgi:pimeloyl-ACP methyl ester carboxylesterase
VTDNVPRAGRRVYELVEFLLHNQIITDLRQIHIVGHSLGAHVASQAGKFLFQRFGRKVARITGDAVVCLFL